VRRFSLAAGGLTVGLVASQAGHLLAYALLYGPVAGRMQSTGAHSYFPTFVKTAFGLAAAFVLLAIVVIGLARLLAGRRLGSSPSLSYVRLLAMLFSLQLTFFVVQESVEMAAGAPVTSAPGLLLWGSLGQLPVALLAALALRWIAVRVGPALASLLEPMAGAIRLTPYIVAIRVRPLAFAAATPLETLSLTLTRRGPPL
jgi:hypothetical protein